MNYHWLSLFCATCPILIYAGGNSSSEHSSSESNSAPEPVLAAAGEPLKDRDLSESELASVSELILPDDAANATLDYDALESESMPEPVLKPGVHGPLEDLYKKYYGNNPWIEICWTPVREFQMDEDDEKMKSVCIEYHKIAKKGSIKAEQLLVDMNKQLLKFRTKNSYRSTHIDVLWYGVNDTKARDIDDMRHFYITRGMGADCVFYLTPTDKTSMEFYLDEHVCKNNSTALLWMKKHNEAAEKNRGKGKRGKKTSSESMEEFDEISDEKETKSDKIAPEVDRAPVEPMANKFKKNKIVEGNVENNPTEKASKFKRKKIVGGGRENGGVATDENAVTGGVRKLQGDKVNGEIKGKPKPIENEELGNQTRRKPAKPKLKIEKVDVPVLEANTTVNKTKASSGNPKKYMKENESRRKNGKPSLNKNE